jgi:hypothetical protein
MITRTMTTWQASELTNGMDWLTIDEEAPAEDTQAAWGIYDKLCEQSVNWGEDRESTDPAEVTLTQAEWDLVSRYYPLHAQDMG